MSPKDYRVQPAPDAHSVGMIHTIGTDQTGDWEPITLVKTTMGGIRCDFFNRKTFPIDFHPVGRQIRFSAPCPRLGMMTYLIPLAAWQRATSIGLNDST